MFQSIIVFLLYTVLLGTQGPFLVQSFTSTCTVRHTKPARRLPSSLPLHHSSSEEDSSYNNNNDSDDTVRRKLVSRWIGGSAAAAAAATAAIVASLPAVAAPPISVIAEELGYFPVQNKAGEMVYVPQRVKRKSSEQAIELAKQLSQAGAVMYGAFWCPHCARQKELFGREAWKYIDYVECSPKGFGAQPLICNKQDIDGYPTWVIRPPNSNKSKNKRSAATVLGGERPLEELAQQVNLASFQPNLEQNVPPPLGSTTCK